MSTRDDGPGGSSGPADEGFYFTSSSGTVEPDATTLFQPTSGVTSVVSSAPARRVARWHGGADLGLLVLRVVVGGTFVGHGLQHLFGLFSGPGVAAFGRFLHTNGYHASTVLAWITGGTEILGGGLLILGLFTPLAAAGLLALMVNVIVLKWKLGFFSPGYELEFVLAAAAFTLLFAGPGRVSIDRPTPWYRHPVGTGWFFVLVAAAAAVVVLLVLR